MAAARDPTVPNLPAPGPRLPDDRRGQAGTGEGGVLNLPFDRSPGSRGPLPLSRPAPSPQRPRPGGPGGRCPFAGPPRIRARDTLSGPGEPRSFRLRGAIRDFRAVAEMQGVALEHQTFALSMIVDLGMEHGAAETALAAA